MKTNNQTIQEDNRQNRIVDALREKNEFDVEIQNITDHPLYFRRRTEEGGDIKLEPNMKHPKFLQLKEIQAQIRAENKMFVGTDGKGSHASIIVLDPEVRKLLFDIEEGENVDILTLDAVKELLAINNQKEFNERLQALVVTPSEKYMITKLAEDAGITDAASWKHKAIEALFIKPKNPTFNERISL